MIENSRQVLSLTFLRLLRPLVRILLRNGVAYGTFTEWVKKLYVDVAFEEFNEQNKKPTTSRVSALTGLTRKEVKRLKELEQGDNLSAADQRYNRAIRVLSGWLSDSRFLNKKGEPAELPLDTSFAELVKKYSGDIPTQAMLTTLLEAGSIEKGGNNVRLVKRAYVPANDPIDKLRILGTDTSELITTIDYNLKITDPAQLRFQRKVSNDAIRSDAVPQFKKISAIKAQALLEELDLWLSEQEIDRTTSSPLGERKYVSMGIYFFEQNYSDKEETS